MLRVGQFEKLNFNYFKNFKLSENDTATQVRSSKLIINSGFDKVEISTRKSEKFDDVFQEMREKVPDSTSTIEEKELAISYINRMLACSDIPNPEYWENKKAVIEMEIENIKNEKNINSGEKVSNVWKEVESFIDIYKSRLQTNSFDTESRLEYATTYHSTCMSFYKRLLTCADITEEQKQEYMAMYEAHSKTLNQLSIEYDTYHYEQSNNK